MNFLSRLENRIFKRFAATNATQPDVLNVNNQMRAFSSGCLATVALSGKGSGVRGRVPQPSLLRLRGLTFPAVRTDTQPVNNNT